MRRTNARLSRNTRVMIALTVVLFVLFAVSGIARPQTIRPRNIIEVIRQSVPLGISAVGQSVVIISGGIDLSMGEVITMTNIIATDLMAGRRERTVPVIVLVYGLGVVIGAATGLIIAKTDIHPMVMTFAMGSIVRGGYLLYSGGAPRGRVSPLIRSLGSERIGLFPVSIVVYLLVLAVVIFVFAGTRWGRSVYYLGANRKAALYTGVPVPQRLIFTYAFSSVMAVTAGLVLSGYIGVGSFEVGGDEYMLNSIAAGVVGGSTFNGVGTVAGGAVGALIITVIHSVMTFLGVAETGRLVMRGIIIIVMVAVYMNRAMGTGTAAIRPRRFRKAGKWE